MKEALSCLVAISLFCQLTSFASANNNDYSQGFFDAVNLLTQSDEISQSEKEDILTRVSAHIQPDTPSLNPDIHEMLKGFDDLCVDGEIILMRMLDYISYIPKPVMDVVEEANDPTATIIANMLQQAYEEFCFSESGLSSLADSEYDRLRQDLISIVTLRDSLISIIGEDAITSGYITLLRMEESAKQINLTTNNSDELADIIQHGMDILQKDYERNHKQEETP